MIDKFDRELSDYLNYGNCFTEKLGMDKLIEKIEQELLDAIRWQGYHSKYYIVIHEHGYISVRINGIFGEGCLETFHRSLKEEFNLIGYTNQEIIDALFNEFSKSKYLKVTKGDHLPILSIKVNKQ